MAITREVHYSSIEAVSYTLEQYDIERAVKAYISKTFNVNTNIGHWTFDWHDADDDNALVIHLTQRFEHQGDGVPTTLDANAETPNDVSVI
jgi:hypothetical protein